MINVDIETRLPEFETRAVIAHDDYKTERLVFAVLFKTPRARTEFIELARKGATVQLPRCKDDVHLNCSDDGGGMGDCITCHDCGYSKYPEAFKGTYTINRSIRSYHDDIQARASVAKDCVAEQ